MVERFIEDGSGMRLSGEDLDYVRGFKAGLAGRPLHLKAAAMARVGYRNGNELRKIRAKERKKTNP